MIPAIVISEQNSTIKLLELYIQESGNFKFFAGSSDFAKAYDAVKELSKVFVIVDISVYQELALNFVSKITSDIPNCRVLTISDKQDVDLVIRALRVGACDFISMPIIKDEFINAVNKIYNDLVGKKQKKSKCRIISLYSNKGGVGKTSIAANLAYELAKITKENVALIDLNFQFGDVTTFLDLKPSFNISYMLENLDNINEGFMLATMERYKDTSLYILADAPYKIKDEKTLVKDIPRLFEVLRNTFSYVIVDMSAGFDKKTISALEHSDLILLVTIVNLPALRNCQRCIEMLEQSSIDKQKLNVIVNRYMENDEISSEEAESVLGKNLYWKVPNNYFTMMSAINKGEPASKVNPDSNVALSYKNLALKVSDNMYR